MKDIRKVLLPLSYNNKDLAITSELMIDYELGNIYSRSRNQDIISLGVKDMTKIIDDILNDLIGHNSDIKTFSDISSIIKDIDKWISDIDNINNDTEIIDDINKVYKKLNGIYNDGTTIMSLLNSKLKKDDTGKILSDNDFDDMYLSKLNDTDDKANKYSHPRGRVCTENVGSNSLNFKQGHVILTKDDIGLKNVDYRANNYIHPPEIVCNITDAVNSVNGKTGHVYLDKTDIDLAFIQNWDIANVQDIMSIRDDKYLTPWSFYKVLELFPLFKCSRIFAGFGLYGAMKISGQYIIRTGDFYSTEIDMGNILDMSIGKFITTLTNKREIEIYKMYEGELKHYNPIDYPEGDDYMIIGRCKGFMGAAVKLDGTHVRWGMEEVDRIVSDLTNIDPYDIPIKIDGHSTFLAYLFDSGLIGIFGKSTGIGDDADYVPFVPLFDKYIDMSCGIDFVSCIKEDGTLITYGKDTVENGNITKYIPSGNNYIQVASGDYHSIALTDDGVIVGWGYNDKNIYNVPGGKFIQIDCYGDTNVALSDKGLIHIWGEDI